MPCGVPLLKAMNAVGQKAQAMPKRPEREPSVGGVLALMGGGCLLLLVLSGVANFGFSARAGSEPQTPTASSGIAASSASLPPGQGEMARSIAPVPPPPPAPALSAGSSEVVKLFQAGVGVDIITSYINNSTVSYAMNAEDIVYFHRLGIPSAVIVEMLKRGREQQQIASAAQLPQPVAVQPAQPVSLPLAQPVYVQPAPVSYVNYELPYYWSGVSVPYIFGASYFNAGVPFSYRSGGGYGYGGFRYGSYGGFRTAGPFFSTGFSTPSFGVGVGLGGGYSHGGFRGGGSGGGSRGGGGFGGHGGRR